MNRTTKCKALFVSLLAALASVSLTSAAAVPSTVEKRYAAGCGTWKGHIAYVDPTTGDTVYFDKAPSNYYGPDNAYDENTGYFSLWQCSDSDYSTLLCLNSEADNGPYVGAFSVGGSWMDGAARLEATWNTAGQFVSGQLQSYIWNYNSAKNVLSTTWIQPDNTLLPIAAYIPSADYDFPVLQAPVAGTTGVRLFLVNPTFVPDS